MVHKYAGGWSTHLLDVLWAYRTSPRNVTGFSPCSLVYGSKAISPVKMMMPTTRVSTFNDVELDDAACVSWRWKDLELLEEKRAEATGKTALYHQHVTKAYNFAVKPHNFKERDLVLRTAKHIRRQIFELSKLAPYWE
ncbi:uncharacterized protein LOC126611890 [Malus sylvestris]|uniref:uncharacterized protein LOC126611890 n=1 Tax=Malus sylvestris TaxID=3752 RepID=UPI0021AC9F80|nr:uncharacterized protein LOC126611890 [Malus sylvestris]